MKISVLTDNHAGSTVRPNTAYRISLSLKAEALFDTGQSDLFLKMQGSWGQSKMPI